MDSPYPLLKKHWPLVLAALLLGLYGWALVAATGLGHDGVIGPSFNALGADWVIFLAASRAYFTGDLGHIYNQAWITTATNSQFHHWLSAPLPFPLFPYPPVFLLLVLPFSGLSVGWSLLTSQILQFIALAWALGKLGRPYGFFLVGALFAPAAANNVLAGSNAVVIAALIVAGVAYLSSKPFLSGVILGIVLFKPQFFLLLPFALVGARKGRALTGMLMSTSALVLLTVALFGPGLWLDWFGVYLHPQQVAGMNATDWGHMWDDSVSTCATLLGLARGWAQAVQVLVALASIALSFWVFRIAHPQRLGILLCAALLASPHISNYDLILAAVAGLLLLRSSALTSGPLVFMLPLAGWLAPLYNPPRAMALGLITPLVILGLIWALFRQNGDQNPLSTKG